MGKDRDVAAKQVKDSDFVYLDQIDESSTGPIVVMVCRRWDVISIRNKYMSTDYIISDKKGNVLHCFVKAGNAFRFKQTLEEGGVYIFKDFSVAPNPERFRIMKDATYMIELQGSTIVSKTTDDTEMFTRYPFQLVPFEKIIPTENRFFVDVVGYVTIVGAPSKKSTGSQTVEFNLTNERGQQLRVTLWGGLGDSMIRKKTMHPGVYVILLTSMSAKEYLGNLCLSSSSATILIDDENIPVIKSFKTAISGSEIVDTGLPLLQVRPTISTLRALMEWGRTKSKKEAGAFQGSIEITNVRTRRGWFNYTCTSGKCRKGVEPNPDSVFYCESCEKEVKFPRPRYRLQLDITDGTEDVVVVLFDETAEKLVGRPVRDLITEAEKDETGALFVLPPVLHDLIGSFHVFEIRTQTYFHAGDYESFNCSRILLPGPDVQEQVNPASNEPAPVVVSHASSSTAELHLSSPKDMNNISPICTPAKKNEGTKHKISADESEPDFLDDEDAGEGVGTDGLRKRKKRIEETDSEGDVGEDAKGKKQA